jgi:hypothetical protein
MKTVLHKDNDRFAIVTTAESEDEFRGQFAAALTEMIDADTYSGDWAFHIAGWLEPAGEIVCKFRGYKSQVVERRTIIAGVLDPDAAILTVSESKAATA